MSDHEYAKELEKIERETLNKERLEDIANYNQYLEYKKREKFDKMKEYKEFLDKQHLEHRDVLQNNQRMTRNEKGLNKLDLQAFKNFFDPGMYNMLPGWSP